MTLCCRYTVTILSEIKMSMELFHVDSYIRRYHAYMGIWEPKVDELFELKREPQNKKIRMLWQLLAKNVNQDQQDLFAARLLQNHILTLTQ